MDHVDYGNLLATSDTRIKRFERLVTLFSWMRLLLALCGIAAICVTVQFSNVLLTELTFFGIVLIFFLLVRKQSAYSRELAFYRALAKVTLNEANNRETYANLYDNGSAWADDEHPYTSDLDVFGKGSLFGFINRAATPAGNSRLAEWLKAPSAAGEIALRQKAVAEIASGTTYRLELQAELLFSRDTGPGDVKRLIDYMQVPGLVVSNALSRYLGAAAWLILAALVAGYFFPVILYLALAIGLTNYLCVFYYNRQVTRAGYFVSKSGNLLSGFARAFARLEGRQWATEKGASLAAAIAGNKKSFAARILQFSKLASYLEYRYNIFVGPFLNLVAAWDLRQVVALERWKQANKHDLESAFDALATFEALISLAALHSNFPDWAFPVVRDPGNFTYEARAMGHPLIPAAKNVANDYSLRDERKIDIVTGSNMAGKSTFLRTIGTNAVLAFAGAPVCAGSMEISTMQLFSYMRIKDSLQESISTFRAELKRLGELLEKVRTEEKVFFLIDEMLRGTNSADKYYGSRAVVKKLIGHRAVGLVATHDLELARLKAEYPDYVRNYYFDISLDGGEMTFDYKLKEGECKTFNASILLEQLGIY